MLSYFFRFLITLTLKWLHFLPLSIRNYWPAFPQNRIHVPIMFHPVYRQLCSLNNNCFTFITKPWSKIIEPISIRGNCYSLKINIEFTIAFRGKIHFQFCANGIDQKLPTFSCYYWRSFVQNVLLLISSGCFSVYWLY